MPSDQFITGTNFYSFLSNQNSKKIPSPVIPELDFFESCCVLGSLDENINFFVKSIMFEEISRKTKVVTMQFLLLPTFIYTTTTEWTMLIGDAKTY